LLEEKGQLIRCYTQNIDSLERAAGVSPDLLIAAHGNFDTATCIETKAKVDVGEFEEVHY
jgi:NAD-dependent SIR2 family protein deacetylase